jgi:hypothetical protein
MNSVLLWCSLSSLLPPMPLAQPDIKVATPDAFDGSADCTEEFLHHCKIYFLGVQGLTEVQKVTFTLSYMLKGHALSWAERALEEVVTPNHEVNWEQFKADIQSTFGDSDHAVMAHIKIREVQQGKGSVDDFVIRFKEFETLTGFNETTLIEQFKEGLTAPTLSWIYGLAQMLATLAEWKVRAYHQYLELQACQHSLGGMPGQRGTRTPSPSSVPCPCLSSCQKEAH